MTTKEKAYDEALKRAKVYYNNAKEAGDYSAVARYENLFPELAESEDERIRKEIIDIVTSYRSNCVYEGTHHFDDCLAWLEKQKVNTEGDFARGYDCGYECCLNSHGAEWFEKQKEPHYTKRNELFDKCVENCDPEVMKEVSDKVDEMLQKEQKQEVKDPFDDEQFKRGYDAGKYDGYQEGYKAGMESTSYRFPTMPATPSGFGCDGIHCTNPHYDCINCPRKDSSAGRITTIGTGTNTLSTNDDNPSGLKATNKSLDEINKETLAEQKEQKQEWSEENEDMLNCCISSIEEAKENRYAYKETDGDTSYDREIAFLKSLRPQPKQEWDKKDEEALERAIDCVRTWEIDYCDGDNEISERLKSFHK